MVDSLRSRRGTGADRVDRSDAVARVGTAERQGPEPPTRAKPSVDILHFGSSDLIACAGPCIITVSLGITLAGVNELGRGMALSKLRYPTFCSFAISERRTGNGIDPECREMLVDLSRKYTHVLSGTATVFEGSGFRATALRSLVTGIQLASSSSHPAKVFASVQPAVEWLASTQPTGAIDVSSLTQSIALLRAQLKEKASEHERKTAMIDSSSRG